MCSLRGWNRIPKHCDITVLFTIVSVLILAVGRRAQSGYPVTRRWAFCPSVPPLRKLRVYCFLYYFSYICLCVFLKIVKFVLPSTHTSLFHALLHKTIVAIGQGLITTPPTRLSPIFHHVKMLALYVTFSHHIWKLCHRVWRNIYPPNMARYLTFICPCIASIYLKYNQQDSTYSRFIYFYKLLYMFQAVPQPIIRSTKLYIQRQVLSNQYCCLLLSWMSWNSMEIHLIHDSSSIRLTIPDAVCTVLCS